MYARLGFAIAIYVEPQILLVDEVLAVGDENFQRRCLDAIERLRSRGVTILLVSHSLNQVLSMCDQCLWLDGGTIQAMGDVREVVRRYLAAVDAEIAQQLLDDNARRLLGDEADTPTANTAPLSAPPRRWGAGPIRITDVQMFNQAEEPSWSFAPLEPVVVKVTYQASQPVAEPIFSILIHKLDGHYLWASNTYDQPVAPITQAGPGELTVQIAALALTAGRYALSAAAYPEPDPPYWRTPSDYHEQLYQFQVLSATVIHGDVVMPSQWSHHTAQIEQPMPQRVTV